MASRSASDGLRFGAVSAAFPGWGLVEVAGRHRERYLQSQVTSDVRALDVGDGQLSALLDASGRLQSFFFLAKLEHTIRLLVPSEAVADTTGQLRSRVIADDVEVSEIEIDRPRLVLGPGAVELRSDLGMERTFPVAGWGSRGVVCWTADDLGLPGLDAAELEARRVVSGVPRWGIEVAAGMLVNETTLIDTAVSFTKGCYLGQETVAKLASHRGAAYQPVLLRLDDGSLDDPESTVGASFAVGERERAGTVLSAAAWEGQLYLQARLWRELRVAGLAVDCRLEDGRELPATVVPLPLLAAPSPREMADDLYLRASELFSSDREDEAIVVLERALAVCPTHADSYESLGVILGRHGRFEEAIELMRRLLSVDPDSVMAHTNMSVYHNQLGRIEEAEREARAAAAKSLERARRTATGADGVRRQREQEQADRDRREEMFRQVLAIDPDDTLANFGLGQLMVDGGDPAAAIPMLERAIAADRSYSAAYLALGRAFEGVGNGDRACETYRDGVRVAARRGDLKTANTMQGRLAALESSGTATN